MATAKLMTPEELSDLLSIPEKTLADWRSQNTGPAYLRVGRHCRYRPEDVEAWLLERYATPRPAA